MALGEQPVRLENRVQGEDMSKKRPCPECARLKARIAELEPFEPRMTATSTPTDMRIMLAKGFLKPIVEALDAMNGDNNYTVTEASCGDRKYEITVRRWDKPTAHDLRKQAEAEADRLRKELEQARAKIAAFS